MLKVSRQRGMLVQQARLLSQNPFSSSHVKNDPVGDFHGTRSSLPCERGNEQMGCQSFKAVTVRRQERLSFHYLAAFRGSQTVEGSGCLRTHIHTLKGEAGSHRHEGTKETNDSHVQASLSTERRSFKVEAARQNTSQGLVISDHEIASGSIHLIVGPMFAGKTTALLHRVEAAASTGRRVALVKSDKDTRYGLDSIVSHDGRKMPCWAVPSLASFKSQIGEEEYAKLDLIGIDEAQFFKDLCSFCQIAADYDSKTLIVAGLDGDFQRNKFGYILDLVPLADSIVKLSSHCELCGKPASFTFRKTDDRNKEVIGGTDIYMPVCRQHYYSGQVALEATRTVLGTQNKFRRLQAERFDEGTNLLFDSEL